MLHFIKQALHKELIYYYFKWAILSHLLNELIILTVFWYTAKAFVPNLEVFKNNASDYFTFIVIGETALRIPSFLISVFTRNLKNWVIEGALETYLLYPGRQTVPFILSGIASALFELIKIIIIITMAKTIFTLHLPVYALLWALIFQLCCLPLFIGLGLISTTIFLYLGRGDGIIMKLTSLATILAGAYFPTSVMPEHLEKIVNWLSPFNLLLNTTRQIITLETTSLLSQALSMALTGIFFLLVGYWLFNHGLTYYKKKSKPFTFVA